MNNVSTYTCFGFFITGTAAYILGFSTPWWISVVDESLNEISSWGLWMKCTRTLVIVDGDEMWSCTMLDLSKIGVELIVIIALMCVSLLLIACDLVFYIAWLVGVAYQWIGVFATGFSFLSGILSVIPLLLFERWYGDNHTSWSYAFCCVGSAIFILNGLLFFIMIIRERNNKVSQ